MKHSGSSASVKHPDSKIHGANMGPTWVLSAPGGPHVGPMNLAVRASLSMNITLVVECWKHIYFTTMAGEINWLEHRQITEMSNFDVQNGGESGEYTKKPLTN